MPIAESNKRLWQWSLEFSRGYLSRNLFACWAVKQRLRDKKKKRPRKKFVKFPLHLDLICILTGAGIEIEDSVTRPACDRVARDWCNAFLEVNNCSR